METPVLRERHRSIVQDSKIRRPPRNFGSPYILMGGFSFLIAIGTLLLSLPFTNTENEITPFLDALFTATSAVTVTGLVVVDTSTHWSFIGQLIIVALIFTGGLGIMASATFLLVLIGRRITLANRLMVRESLGVYQLGGLIGLARRIVIVIVSIQIIGFLVLFIGLIDKYPINEAWWLSLFHSISGFNNAGFVIFPDSVSLSIFKTDYIVLLTMSFLILLGTLSYSVMLDIFGYRRKFNRYTLDSKMVVTATLGLLIIGFIVFLISEYSNPDTLGELRFVDKIINTIFIAVSGRTAGFSTVDFGSMEQHSNFFLTSLMFIGGASASTAGGIKVNTFAVLIAAVLSSIAGRNHVVAFGREIPHPQVYRAMTVLILGLAIVFAVALLLTITENLMFIDILFETVSAFCTVGLSTGITDKLSDPGKYIIVFTMFIGRVGPLTIALLLAQKEATSLYRYAEERIKIG